jgi:hypothetical protein
MRGERGQATVEWLGLLLLAALVLVALLWLAGPRLPGTSLTEAIAERLICAVRLSDGCRSDPALFAAYGQVAELLRAEAPTIVYEDGMRALPVDFRRCREPACGDGPAAGRVDRSQTGIGVAAFTHVIDCRDPAAGTAAGFDCSAGRAGNLYLQYWLYYPDSATYRGVPFAEDRGFHRDDWESYAVRIEPSGRVYARASSHNGYNGPDDGMFSWASDAAGHLPGASEIRDAQEATGLRNPGGWTPAQGRLYVSGGSHAGHASESSLRRTLSRLLAGATIGASGERFEGPFAAHDRKRRAARLAARIERDLFGPGARTTPRGSLTLIPIESLAGSGASFAITPPWRKRVYRDPEYQGTN